MSCVIEYGILSYEISQMELEHRIVCCLYSTHNSRDECYAICETGITISAQYCNLTCDTQNIKVKISHDFERFCNYFEQFCILTLIIRHKYTTDPLYTV